MPGSDYVMKKGLEIVINFIYRMVFGIICIYFLNQLISLLGGSVQVGLNTWTIGLTGMLGIPGVVLLFVIRMMGGL